MLRSRLVTEATILPGYQFLMIIAWAYSKLGTHLSMVLRRSTIIISCLDDQAQVQLPMPQRHSIRLMVVNEVMTKETISSLVTMFSRQCAPSLCGIWYIYPGLWGNRTVRWLCSTPPPPLAGCDVAVNVIYLSNIPEPLNYPLKHYWNASEYVFTNDSLNMVNTCRKHVKCIACKKFSFHKNRLEAYYQHYHPIPMNEGLLADGIVPPAEGDWPKPSWFDLSWCTWMVINELVNK